MVTHQIVANTTQLENALQSFIKEYGSFSEISDSLARAATSRLTHYAKRPIKSQKRALETKWVRGKYTTEHAHLMQLRKK